MSSGGTSTPPTSSSPKRARRDQDASSSSSSSSSLPIQSTGAAGNNNNNNTDLINLKFGENVWHAPRASSLERVPYFNKILSPNGGWKENSQSQSASSAVVDLSNLGIPHLNESVISCFVLFLWRKNFEKFSSSIVSLYRLLNFLGVTDDYDELDKVAEKALKNGPLVLPLECVRFLSEIMDGPPSQHGDQNGLYCLYSYTIRALAHSGASFHPIFFKNYPAWLIRAIFTHAESCFVDDTDRFLYFCKVIKAMEINPESKDHSDLQTLMMTLYTREVDLADIIAGPLILPPCFCCSSDTSLVFKPPKSCRFSLHVTEKDNWCIFLFECVGKIQICIVKSADSTRLALWEGTTSPELAEFLKKNSMKIEATVVGTPVSISHLSGQLDGPKENSKLINEIQGSFPGEIRVDLKFTIGTKERS